MTKKTKNIVAQGGGCFPAGTKINTPKGYRFIEDLKKGDEVYAFDLTPLEAGMPDQQPGRVLAKKITKTFTHSFGEVGYTSPLLEIEYGGLTLDGRVIDGVLRVTGNHYILTPSKQSEETDPGFARADQLEIGDTLWTQYGEEVKITAIKDGGEYDFVYNFEVAKLKTYIADGIRVHNGGGGKDNRQPRQAVNTIRNKQVIRVLLSPGEGEAGGLYNTANPTQSVFFDGTPLQNPDGTFNFNNIGVIQRTGLPDQTVIEGFSAVEAEQLVGINVTAVTPIVRTLSSASVDAARVTIEFTQGLQKIDKETGDANGTAVSFAIARRVSPSGTWENVLTPTVSEMSSGPFTASYLIPRPAAAGVWEFRVTRTTPDSVANEVIDDTMVKSFTEIQNVSLPYNDRGLVGIMVGADSTNGRIPSIALDWVGVKIQVPSNYNPVTRTYSGSWNGVFSTTRVSSDNPAWVIYDLITNERYGLGDRFSPEQIDKWSFYEAAKYCDELVNDGKGTGTFEPRFTFNAQLMVRENAWKTLNTIAATMNAKLYMHAGFVRVAQDRATTPTRIISNSTVLEGLFTYSSSTVEDTYTQCNVTFNDPADNFLPKTVSEVASNADIVRYGLNSVDLAAYGATTEGQARRAGKWVLDTSLRQSSMVSFGVSLEHAGFEPNEIFYLMDEDYSQTTQEGRLVAISGSTLTLDKPFVKTSGGTWTITLYAVDGTTIQTYPITTGAGTVSTITVTGTPTAPVGSAYIITGAISPRQFRMINMTDNGDLTYGVQAVQHDPNKYARVEQGIILPEEVYWQSPALNAVDIPTMMVITPQTAINDDGVIHRYLDVSWTPPADGTAQQYHFQWRRNDQELKSQMVKEPFARLEVDFSGIFEFYVVALNSANVASPTLMGAYNFNFTGIGGPDSVLGPVTGLQLEGGAASFSGTMRVVWTAPVDSVVKDYHVKLATPVGTVFKEFDVTATGFVYTYDQNVGDGGPRPAIQVTVQPRDTLNKLGPAVAATFSSQPAAGISNLFVRGTGLTTFSTLDLEVTWDSLTSGGVSWRADPNFAYFNVEVKKGAVISREVDVTDAAFTYSFNDNVKDNGQDTPSNAITLTVTQYNKLGVAGSSATATFEPATPPAVTNLFVKGTSDVIFNENDLNATWSCAMSNGQQFNTSNMFKRFKVEALNGATLRRENSVFAPEYTYTLDQNSQDNVGTPIRNPVLRVTAVSVYNMMSAPLSVSFSNPPPAIPSNINVLAGIGNYKVAFDRPAELDYLGTYIWASTTSNFTPAAANLVADINGAYASINSVPGTVFYVKLAAYDVFGKGAKDGAGLNISAQSTVASISAGIPSDDTAPTTGMVEGDFYYNTTNKTLYKYLSGAWVPAIRAVDISGQLTSSQIADLDGAKLTGTITATTVTDNAITTPKIAAGAVVTAKLAANAVTANEIAANAVTAGKIAANAVTANEIAANSITSDEIAANAVTAVKILAGSISTDKLAANSVTAANIVSNAITADKIATGAVSADEISAGAITTVKLDAQAVTAAKIAAGTITATQIASGTITATQIASGTITATQIASGTITADRIAAGVLTVADASITNAKIANAAVNTLKIAGNSVTVPTSEYIAGVVTGSYETEIITVRQYVSPADLTGVSAIKLLIAFGCHCYSNHHETLTMTLRGAREYDQNNTYVFAGFPASPMFSAGGGGLETQMQGQGMEGGQVVYSVTLPGTYIFRLFISSPGYTAYASKRYMTILQAKR